MLSIDKIYSKKECNLFISILKKISLHIYNCKYVGWPSVQANDEVPEEREAQWRRLDDG